MIKKFIKSASIEAVCLLVLALLAGLLTGLVAGALVLAGTLSLAFAAGVGILCGTVAAGAALGACAGYKIHDRFFPDNETSIPHHRALRNTSLGLCAAGTVACGVLAGRGAMQIPLVDHQLAAQAERGAR